MAQLTLQDKLALAMTSAGSQRALARELGITHQKLGRWLREGEQGGVKAIPAVAAPAIGAVFKAHTKATRDQARADRIPFDPERPVYVQRAPTLRTGEPSERTFADNTQYIREKLREEIIVAAQQSKQYFQVSIRSVIDFSKYAWNTAFEAVVSKVAKRNPKWDIDKVIATVIQRHGEEVNNRAEAIDANVSEDAARRKRVIDTSIPFALYTQYENISPTARDPKRAARNVSSKLRQKHEPATGEKGTKLADQFLFQLVHQPKPANVKKTVRTRKGNRR